MFDLEVQRLGFRGFRISGFRGFGVCGCRGSQIEGSWDLGV